MRLPELVDAVEDICEQLDIDPSLLLAKVKDIGIDRPELTVPELLLIALARLLNIGAERDVNNRYPGREARKGILEIFR